MRILLLGYGKMGRAIEQIAQERGHLIAGRIDLHNRDEVRDLKKEDVDVAIEFSAPEAATENIRLCLEKGWPVVSGTTGWLSYREEIEALCKAASGGFFYASNYSIGVNLFFQLNKYLAAIMKGQPYGVAMTEIHHIHKKDAPSGTAITLAEGIREGNDQYKGWTLAPEVSDGHVPITSERVGEVPGTHVVEYASETDTITITHTAHSRQGFALGAVIAAEWMAGRSGIYGMADLLDDKKGI